MNKLSLFTCISLKRQSAPLKNNQKSEDLIQLCLQFLFHFVDMLQSKVFFTEGILDISCINQAINDT